MTPFFFVRSLFQKRLFAARPRRHGRRHSSAFRSPVDALEARLLLSATQTNPLSAVVLDGAGDSEALDLSQFFDDPEVSGSTVRITTPRGSFYVETFDTITPITAANFLDLIRAGRYDDMFMHRSVNAFVLQGGGFTFPEGGASETVEHNGTIVNEFDNWFDPNLGGLEAGAPVNLRGTLAMAKVGGNPNSATSQWFVSVRDNQEILDPQNGGFTVFARVLYNGMDVVDQLMELEVVNAGGVFSELPVIDLDANATSIARENLVLTSSEIVDELTLTAAVATDPNGLVTASVQNGVLTVTATSQAASSSGTATVRITAVGLDGQEITADLTVAVGLQQPAAVNVTSAVANQSSGFQPTITWPAESNSTQYDLWLSRRDSTGLTLIKRADGLSDTTFSDNTVLENGQSYTVWVRGRNAALVGPWGTPFHFVAGTSVPTAVDITSPADRSSVTENRRPQITWTTSEAAASYDVWISRDGESGAWLRTTTTDAQFTPESDLPTGVYRVWVKAQNGNGASAWSSPVTIGVGGTVSQLNAPTGDPIPARPTFAWTPGIPGVAYQLWVNQVGGTSKVVFETGLTTTSFTATSDLAAGPYVAWVRQLPASGPPLPWSSVFRFEVGPSTTPPAPTLTVDTTGQPTFNWATVTHAVRYELWVNGPAGPRVLHETNLTALEFVATSLQTGNHRAWLRAFSATGAVGPWSNTVDFVV